MTRLRVSFLAGGFGLLPIDETVLGSFLWNTQTNVISNASLTCYGPYTFLPSNPTVKFSPPPAAPYAAGIVFFEFADAGGTVVFQLNFDDQAYTSGPITPTAGSYTNVPFDLGGTGLGRNAPGTGMVIVTAANDVNTPVRPPSGLTVTVE